MPLIRNQPDACWKHKMKTEKEHSKTFKGNRFLGIDVRTVGYVMFCFLYKLLGTFLSSNFRSQEQLTFLSDVQLLALMKLK